MHGWIDLIRSNVELFPGLFNHSWAHVKQVLLVDMLRCSLNMWTQGNKPLVRDTECWQRPSAPLQQLSNFKLTLLLCHGDRQATSTALGEGGSFGNSIHYSVAPNRQKHRDIRGREDSVLLRGWECGCSRWRVSVNTTLGLEGAGAKHRWAKSSVVQKRVGQVNTERATSCPTQLRQGWRGNWMLQEVESTVKNVCVCLCVCLTQLARVGCYHHWRFKPWR